MSEYDTETYRIYYKNQRHVLSIPNTIQINSITFLPNTCTDWMGSLVGWKYLENAY
jgi:hypothetical protein